MAECQSVSLASFVAQVRGVMFYGLQLYGARQGEHVVLVRRPNNPYDSNCLEVRLVRSRISFVLGHLAAEVAVHLSPLLCDAPLKLEVMTFRDITFTALKCTRSM